MDKDFIQYVYARIEKALTENAEYMKLQDKLAKAGHDIMLQNREYEDLTCQKEGMSQELCYMQGFNDAMRMILNSK
jgi:hypothetical protein